MNDLYIFHKALNLGVILRPDPISWLISSLSENPIYKYRLLTLSEGIIFIVLLFILNRQNKQNLREEVPNLELGLISILSISFIFFLDRSLLLLPFLNSLLLILNSDYFVKKSEILTKVNFLAFTLISALAIVIAKPFSLLLFILLLLKNLSVKDNLIKVSLFLLGILALYISFDNIPIFDYPRDSNVVPYSPLVHAGAVDFGVDNMPFTSPYLDYLTQRGASYLVLLSLSLSLLFFQLKNRQFKKSHSAILSSIFCGAVLLFDHVSFTNLIDVPLIRLLPGLAYLALPMFIPLLIAVFLLGLLNLQEQTYKYSLALALCLQIILTSKLPIPEVFALEKNSLTYLLKQGEIDQRLTPSNYLLEEYEGLKVSSYHSKYHEIELDKKCIPSASPHSENAFKALDKKPESRWATKAPQKTGDYFELACNEEIQFNKVEMLLGSNQTDFPRGISVMIDGSKILNLQDWLGPIRQTKKGLTYFGAQQEVELTFAHTQKFKTIRFVIERGDKTFDWSIGEIKFYRDSLI